MELSNEIRWAALESVARHLEGFELSSALEELWENHPELIDSDMEVATRLAVQVAESMRGYCLQGVSPVLTTFTPPWEGNE